MSEPKSKSGVGEAPKYHLDPDFRRDAPKEGPYCVRCQKPIRDPKKAAEVTVNWDTWEVTEGGEDLMGLDCWRTITREL